MSQNEKGFKDMSVRFFMYDDEESEYIECDESDSLEAEGVIEYERHTVLENGVKQICLTKNPFHGC